MSMFQTHAYTHHTGSGQDDKEKVLWVTFENDFFNGESDQNEWFLTV